MTYFFTTRRKLASLLVLFVGLLLVPTSVDAGCGDYVLVGNLRHHAGSSQHSQGMNARGADAHSFSELLLDKENSRPLQSRCHGPNCSDRSSAPAVPVPQVNPSVDRWAYSVNAQICSVLSCSPLLAESLVCVTDNCGLSILRPPR
jgi:hypothetical protein